MDQDVVRRLRAAVLNCQEHPVTEMHLGVGLTGYSGRKLIRCLTEFSKILCSKNAVYLELGVFQGLTLISNAVANPAVPCFGIDNFSLFNEGRKNLSIVQSRIAANNATNAAIINLDYESALRDLGKHIGNRQIGVFFVDGPHDYRSQLLPILLAKPYLADACAIVVDDSNYAHVRQANGDFLRTNPEFALLFEAYTPAHIANLRPADKEEAIAGWWNGVNVMVRDPSGQLPRRYPPEHAKHLYVESHEVFRHEFAELALPALMAAQAHLDNDPQAARVHSDLMAALANHRRGNPERFRHQNTYSAKLPAFQIHI